MFNTTNIRSASVIIALYASPCYVRSVMINLKVIKAINRLKSVFFFCSPFHYLTLEPAAVYNNMQTLKMHKPENQITCKPIKQAPITEKLLRLS